MTSIFNLKGDSISVDSLCPHINTHLRLRSLEDDISVFVNPTERHTILTLRSCYNEFWLSGMTYRSGGYSATVGSSYGSSIIRII